MSANCTKDFQISVTPANNTLYLYWQLDSFGPPQDFGLDTTPDAHGTRRATVAGTPTLVPGKISNGIHVTNRIARFAEDFTLQDFTVRLWINPTGPVSFASAIFAQHLTVLGHGWQFYKGAVGDDIRFQVIGTLGASSSPGEALTNGAGWQRVIGRWNNATKKADIRVQDGFPQTPIFGTDPGVVNVSSRPLEIRSIDDGSGRDASYDEFGIWYGYLWTQADSDYDWNSGNGRTYPDVLNIG